MYHWCTDEVEPQDRFDHWREVRAKGLFGVTAELERERRADFFGEFSLRQLGGAGLVELKASHYTVERSTPISPTRPATASASISSSAAAAGSAACAATTSRSPMAASPPAIPTCPIAPRRSAHGGFHLRILKIPVSEHCPRRTSACASSRPRRSAIHAPGAPARRLLCRPRRGRQRNDDGAEPIADLPRRRRLAHLALIERGILRPGSRRGQAALRTARLSLARRLIAQPPAEPDLAPTMVADLLGVSVRHLHMLFETAEKSFSQTVTDERLKQSRRLMREAPERLIADIATACGFESLATYYRVFNAAYGMAPGDFRAQGRESGVRLSARPPSRPIDPAGAEKPEPRPLFGQKPQGF